MPLTKQSGELGAIFFGKGVGQGTAMAVDRLGAVRAGAPARDAGGPRRARQRPAENSYDPCEVGGNQLPAERLEVRPGPSVALNMAEETPRPRHGVGRVNLPEGALHADHSTRRPAQVGKNVTRNQPGAG